MLTVKIFDQWMVDERFDRWEMNIFHSIEWRNAITSGFGGKWLFIVLSVKNEPIVVLPILSKKAVCLKLLGSPMRGTFTLYTGPIFKKDLDPELRLNAITRMFLFLKELDFSSIEVVVSAGSIGFDEIMRGASECGFNNSTVQTIELDLSVGKDEVWNKMEGRARTAIRKAEKNGVVVENIEFNEPQVDLLYSMLQQTFARQGSVVPHTKKAYYAIAKNLRNQNQYFFSVARIEGTVVGCGLYLIDGKKLIFHSGANSEKGYSVGASSLLKWSAFSSAIDRGLDIFDFGGIGIQSIDKFKSSFGGQSTRHVRFYKNSKVFVFVEQLMYNKKCRKLVAKILRRLKII
jgi:hypothetical protein